MHSCNVGRSVTQKSHCSYTSDISFNCKGIHGWFNNEKTILDLEGCDNLVNSNFVSQHLRLPVLTDTSAAAQHIYSAISVNGDKFKFTSYAEIMCNFNGHREKIRFYLMTWTNQQLFYQSQTHKQKSSSFQQLLNSSQLLILYHPSWKPKLLQM